MPTDVAGEEFPAKLVMAICTIRTQVTLANLCGFLSDDPTLQDCDVCDRFIAWLANMTSSWKVLELGMSNVRMGHLQQKLNRMDQASAQSRGLRYLRGTRSEVPVDLSESQLQAARGSLDCYVKNNREIQAMVLNC